MATHLAFSELDGPFDLTTSLSVDTNTTRKRDWCRASFRNNTSSTPAFVNFPFNLSTGWAHAFLAVQTSSATGNVTTAYFSFMDQVSNFHFGILSPTHPTFVSLSAPWEAENVLLFSGLSDNPQPFSFNWNIDALNGFLFIYAGNELVYSFNGDTTNSSTVTSISALRFSRNNSSGTVGNVNFSEIIVADESTIANRLITLPLTATGSINDWSGDPADIIPVSINDATTIESSTDGDIITRDLVTLNPLGDTEIVKAVAISARANALGIIDQLTPVTRIASTNYTLAPTPLTSGFEGRNAVWSINPDTSLLWTVADINAAEFGFRANETV
jgi:hypothetical protein